jgi:hypothetical protein
VWHDPIKEAIMHSDDDPSFDAEITDIEGQQQRALLSIRSRHPRWHWDVEVSRMCVQRLVLPAVLEARTSRIHPGQRLSGSSIHLLS